MNDIFHWVLAGHIIAIISWMAGMLYLPRLYVYHVKATPGGELSETLKIMERRLLRYIINPAMISAWILGIWLVRLAGWDKLSHEGWFYGKIALVIGLQLIHACFARWRRHFANDQNRHSEKFYRVINEVPTVLMIGIVILAMVQPF